MLFMMFIDGLYGRLCVIGLFVSIVMLMLS